MLRYMTYLAMLIHVNTQKWLVWMSRLRAGLPTLQIKSASQEYDVLDDTEQA